MACCAFITFAASILQPKKETNVPEFTAEFFDSYLVRIVETVVVIAIYIGARNFAYRLINKHHATRLLNDTRGLAIKKVIHTALLFISFMLIALIWGVKQSDLAVFIGSLLTIVGVAFFAQWSLLSNFTAAVIIFFNHPIKINDSIIILEAKDYTIEGKVLDIGLIFITLETPDGQSITLPNNIFIQKSIKKIIRASVEEGVALKTED
ncbi:MAG: mechanosensitive ion channel family protein [Flavobacteriales bacterium]